MGGNLSNIHLVSTIGVSALYCEGLRHILDKRIFQVGENLEAIEPAIQSGPASQNPRALLINVARRLLPGSSVIARLRERYPEARLVLIEEVCNGERIQQAIEIDLDGYLLETIHPLAFAKALELILVGERVFPVPHLKPAFRCEPEVVTPAFEELSESQMRVVALLAHAYPNKVIARELGISESTVKVHVKAILRKTGARNRTDVALLARGFEDAAGSRSAEMEIEILHANAGAEAEEGVLDRCGTPLPQTAPGRRSSVMTGR
jgi:two-component system nitrate/nitrite response regulator NarL